MRKDLLVKSTLGAMAVSVIVMTESGTLSVRGYDSISLVSDKAIAGMDISVENLINAGGTDVYEIEMDNLITNSVAQSDDGDSDDDKTAQVDKADKTKDNNTQATGNETDVVNDDQRENEDKPDADENSTDNNADLDADSDNADKPDDDSDTEKTDEEADDSDEKKSALENVGVSVANDYVNVRQESNTESEIVGKLYRGCAATIIENNIKQADGEWTKIQSGKVTGYIKKEYLAIGFDAEELVDQFGTRYATVNTTTLNVRTEMSTDCKIVTQIPVGETYEVIKEYDEWVEIAIDDDLTGYVSKEFVDMSVEFKKAVSIQEEQEQIEKERKAREAQAEQERKLKEQQEAARKKAEEEKKKKEEAEKKNQSQTKTEDATGNKDNSDKKNASSSDKGDSGKTDDSSQQETASPSGTTGESVASYALNFVGNRYVWGGTSLTNGTDCSGFTMSVYKAFGYSLPHHSGSQALCGKSVTVSTSTLKPGDLLFYTNSSGRVNHVTMYIGNGQVVHASNERDGIKISRYNYRTPYCARRIIY